MKWAIKIPVAPSRACNPNYHGEPDRFGKYPSHRQLQREKSEAHNLDRNAAHAATISAINAPRVSSGFWRTLMSLPHNQPLLTTWVIHWQCGRRKLDSDNAHASLKWIQDGIARALARDDRYWERGRVKQVMMTGECIEGTGGFVEFTIEELDDEL